MEGEGPSPALLFAVSVSNPSKCTHSEWTQGPSLGYSPSSLHRETEKINLVHVLAWPWPEPEKVNAPITPTCVCRSTVNTNGGHWPSLRTAPCQESRVLGHPPEYLLINVHSPSAKECRQGILPYKTQTENKTERESRLCRARTSTSLQSPDWPCCCGLCLGDIIPTNATLLL